MQNITHRYLKRWEKMETLTWYPELKKYTLDIACQLFIGVETESEEALEKVYEIWSDGLLSIPVRFPGNKFDKAIHAREQLLARFDKLIDQRLQNPAESRCINDFITSAG
jgi:retinoid hydroxylase